MPKLDVVADQYTGNSQLSLMYEEGDKQHMEKPQQSKLKPISPPPAPTKR